MTPFFFVIVANILRGPNWIHGTEHNPIVDISKLSNTLTHSWDGPQTIIDSSGEAMDAVTTGKLSDFMWTTVDKALAYSQGHAATIPSDLSLFDYFREELENTTFTELEKEACLELSKLWGSYIGSPVDRQSLKFFFLEECLEGSTVFTPLTFAGMN